MMRKMLKRYYQNYLSISRIISRISCPTRITRRRQKRGPPMI
jgi:hypothetical protein